MRFSSKDLGSIEGYLGLDKGVDGNLKRYVVLLELTFELLQGIRLVPRVIEYS
jgi:hypothetical protein